MGLTAIRLIIVVLGLLAFAASVWLVGPLIGIADSRPFDPIWARLLLIALAAAVAFGWFAFDLLRRRRAAAALERAMLEPGRRPSDDTGELRKRLQDALEKLRATSNARAGYLYELPWYVMIGPPGSGKTTALVNSGLSFPPLDGGQKQRKGMAGEGGTRNCDWWFTEEAVLLDTAGRYLTQGEQDDAGSRASWLGFLDLLKTHRARQPLNGVIVALSIEDFLAQDTQVIDEHIEKTKSRLIELHAVLKIDLPVYVLFAKMDLVPGFREYFQDLNERERRAVWGTTFQSDEPDFQPDQQARAEFDALIERLTVEVTDRLEDEPVPAKRAELFRLASEMAKLREPLCDFLSRVFETSRYHANVTLRGFYFTSGTQQGRPIDMLIGAQAERLGLQSDDARAGKGKSFFLTDLLREVIIGEAGWVSTDPATERRDTLVRAGIFGAMGLVVVACIVAWFISYRASDETISQAKNAPAVLAGEGEVIGAETIDESNADFGSILPALDKLEALPRNEAESFWESFGLSQQTHIGAAATAAYKRGLNRLLRPRMLFHMEKSLVEAMNDPGKLYGLVKAYLLLGGKGTKTDDAQTLIENVFREELQSSSEAERQALLRHAAAMINLDLPENLDKVNNMLNRPLIGKAQNELAKLGAAGLAFEILRLRAQVLADGRDWKAKAMTEKPELADLVFGASLNEVTVPFFYTYDGFNEAFARKLDGISVGLRAEKRWVLGSRAGDDQPAQNEALRRELVERYAAESKSAWDDALAKLRFQPLTLDEPDYEVLDSLRQPGSPLSAIARAAGAEWVLTAEKKGEPPAEAKRSGDAAKVERQLMDRMVEEESLKAVEDAFGAVYKKLDGKKLNDIDTKEQLKDDLKAPIDQLRDSAERLPAQFSRLVREAAADVEGRHVSLNAELVRTVFRNEVADKCEVLIGPSTFPFVKGARKEVSIQGFGEMFGMGGAFDKFFKDHLERDVDTDGDTWRFKPGSTLGKTITDPSFLQVFKQAAEIREAFFVGGQQPSVTFMVKASQADPAADEVPKLNTGGLEIASGAGPVTVMWPSPPDYQRTWLNLTDKEGTTREDSDEQGPWSLFRFAIAHGVSDKGRGTASFEASGVTFTFSLSQEAKQSPFTLSALRQFKCPQ